ncbi:Alpha/Beta hydrolase fold [Tylopilus felleus]
MSRQHRYIPVFVAEVYDQNAKLATAGLTPINLQSVMIDILKFQPWVRLTNAGEQETSCNHQYGALSCGSVRMNPYDISKKCEGGLDSLCYPKHRNTSPSTRALLGVDPSITSNFSSCNNDVSNIHVSALLERGVRTLIYVGTYDWICDWIGNKRWTLKMPWTGQEAFARTYGRPVVVC